MAEGEVEAVAEDAGALHYIMNDLPDLQLNCFDYEGIGADGAREVFFIDKNQPELLRKVNAGLEECYVNDKRVW